MGRTIRWADDKKREIIISEDVMQEKRTTLENRKRDLQFAREHAAKAQQIVIDLEAEILEIKQTLGIEG